MTTLERWKNRLAARIALERQARREHLRKPTAKTRAKLALRRAQVAWARRVVARNSASSEWGGSRAVTNEVIGIVGKRAQVTSRKRTETFGNPGSDHHVSQKLADAVDFGVAEAHWLKNEISRKLGGPAKLEDYGTFIVKRNGYSYRVQIIAGTHGTGPHLHVGVRRV